MTQKSNTTASSPSSPHKQLEVVSPPFDPEEELESTEHTSVIEEEINPNALQSMQLEYLKQELADLTSDYQRAQSMQRKRMAAIQNQIKALEKMQIAAGVPSHSRAWNITDTVVSWVLVGLSALTLIPIFLVLFGVISSMQEPIRWVSFGLAALAMVAAGFTWMFAKKLPKAKAAAIMFVAVVLMLGFAWLI